MNVDIRNNELKLEDLLLENEFTTLVQRGDTEQIQSFINTYPEHKQIILEAIMLINNLKIEDLLIPDKQIEKDYKRLLYQLSITRKKRYLIRSISTIAACIAIGLLVLFGIDNNKKRDDQSFAYALLDSVDIQSEEVQIIAGTTQLNLKDSATIKQTAQGNVIVNEKEITDSFLVKTEYLQLVVPYGKRSTINFSDGTVVWVNSGSTIVYPQQFQKSKREIFVDGEIYLEVAEDRSRPFVVHSKKFEISVLGTKFNVNSFDKDNLGSVVLVEGSVEVSTKDSKNKLSPNQGLFYENSIAEIKNIDVYPYICWKDGLMKLNGESLDVIFDKLSRYYRVDFKYDQSIANEKYNGKLDLSKSIESILHSLSLTASFTFKKEDNTIQIISN